MISRPTDEGRASTTQSTEIEGKFSVSLPVKPDYSEVDFVEEIFKKGTLVF